jgi:hypothetical protein
MGSGEAKMTKVLLIEPPKAVWDLMGDCVAPPLGLAQVAALLERAPGITVDIVDCNGSGLSWPQLERAIVEAQPDVVGATVLTPYFPSAIWVICEGILERRLEVA